MKKRIIINVVTVLLVLGLSMLFSGCPAPKIPIPLQKPRPKVALVLSGGASRGFAHIGVIKVLEAEHIHIDYIVGTSAGSLTGAMYAYYGNAAKLEKAAWGMTQDDIFDFSLPNILVGVVKGDSLVRFIRSRIPVRNIEDLSIPFAAVATDLVTGEKVVFKKGSISTAVRASTSIPGIFKPLIIGKQILVDGGVVDNVPVDVARAMGADVVIAVDVSSGTYNNNIENVIDVIMQTFNIMGNEISKYQIKEADVVIRPNVSGVGMIDFSKKSKLIAEGERAARSALPAIRKAIEEAGE
jgi:NTE family protein